MIVVTGAAGFIGFNIAKRLNLMGIDDLILLDDKIEDTLFWLFEFDLIILASRLSYLPSLLCINWAYFL